MVVSASSAMWHDPGGHPNLLSSILCDGVWSIASEAQAVHGHAAAVPSLLASAGPMTDWCLAHKP